MNTFPWRDHSDKHLIEEFYKLEDKISQFNQIDIKFPLTKTNVGYPCSNIFKI